MYNPDLLKSLTLSQLLTITAKFPPETIINPKDGVLGIYDSEGLYIGFIDCLSGVFVEVS
jgi:hypothetical protein